MKDNIKIEDTFNDLERYVQGNELEDDDNEQVADINEYLNDEENEEEDSNEKLIEDILLQQKVAIADYKKGIEDGTVSSSIDEMAYVMNETNCSKEEYENRNKILHMGHDLSELLNYNMLGEKKLTAIASLPDSAREEFAESINDNRINPSKITLSTIQSYDHTSNEEEPSAESSESSFSEPEPENEEAQNKIDNTDDDKEEWDDEPAGDYTSDTPDFTSSESNEFENLNDSEVNNMENTESAINMENAEPIENEVPENEPVQPAEEVPQETQTEEPASEETEATDVPVRRGIMTAENLAPLFETFDNYRNAIAQTVGSAVTETDYQNMTNDAQRIIDEASGLLNYYLDNALYPFENFSDQQ